jgi:hypothetical protein
LIDKFGTWQCIDQWGWLNAMQHQLVLIELEQREQRHQESQSYEELKDERLLDEVINEMGTVAAPHVADGNEQRRTAAQEVSKEVRVVSEYLLDIHGLPPVQKGEGVSRIINEACSLRCQRMRSWIRLGRLSMTSRQMWCAMINIVRI